MLEVPPKRSDNISMMSKKYKVHQKGEGVVTSFDTLEETISWIRQIEFTRKIIHGPRDISPFTIITNSYNESDVSSAGTIGIAGQAS